ncbi:toll-like receptor 2 isoform X2 [Mizuhopecten yessoensis]|uniref:toll-like receptor 2 isoform X2 n=1 Tax=Mizuhopecten yessoensis TaxID=6573 RepID=UPI000B45DFC6|nr:toll-like receptor 2 isoform X2 [Mizuhopecten yessoensis]
MKPIFSATILLWVLRLTDVSGYPDCCAVSSAGEDVVCRGCGLDTVPQDLPINATQLDLSNNKLTTLKPKSFLYLPNLQTLKLNRNGMRNITSGAFDGLGHLQFLSLSDNGLDSSLGTNVFQFLNNLRVLDLHRNVFHLNQVYPIKALSHTTSIETLKIDVFHQFSFGIGFSHLKKLRILNLYGMQRCSIRNTSFTGLGSITIIHLIINSRLSFIENDALSPFKTLALLDIDSDRTLNIREVLYILYGLRNQTMEQISFNNNFLPFDNPVKIHTSDIVYLQSICVKRLYLIRNAISSFPLKGITSWTGRRCLEVLDVSQNKFTTFNMVYYLPLFPALTHFSLTCNILSKSRRKRLSFKRFLRDERTLFLPPRLIFLNISHNNIRGYFDKLHFSLNNSLRYFDISYEREGSFRLYINGKGLVHMEELYLSFMDCYHVKCVVFADMPNLAKIVARQCSFESDLLSVNSKSVFNGLRNLTYVDLSENHIPKWDPMTFYDQKDSLRVLMISENEISTFPAKAIEALETLEYVDVSQNSITTLSLSDCNLIDRLKQKSDTFSVNIHGNPLVCSCHDLDFPRWVFRTTVLYNKEHLQCITPNGDFIHFKELHRTFEKFEINCASFSWLIVSTILLILISVLVTVSLVTWRYSAKLRVWCRQPAEGEFSHYVFLSYSNKDTKWVRERLVPHLEQDKLSFICEDKDFRPGKDIATNILDAIDYSYKCVFVVSYHFLSCEWTRYAMQVASGYCFRKGREKINIIILLDDIELSELPKLLRKNWDNIECLRWPHPHSNNSGQGTAAKVTEIEIERAKMFDRLSQCIRKGKPKIVFQDEETLVSETML